MWPGSKEPLFKCSCSLTITTFMVIFACGLIQTAVIADSLSPLCQRLLCDYGYMETCHCKIDQSLDLDQSREVHPKFQMTKLTCSPHDFQRTIRSLRHIEHLLEQSLVTTCFRQAKNPVLLRLKRKTKPHKKPNKKPKTKVRKPEEHTISKSRKFFDDAFLYEVKEKQLRASKYLAMDTIKEASEDKNPVSFLSETTTKEVGIETPAGAELVISDSAVSPKDNRSRRSIPINSGDRWETFTRPSGITWRLSDPYTDPSGILNNAKQRDEITLALGTWERSSNLCFREDTTSQSVNFVIQFRPEVHGFHDFRGTPAHSKSKQYIHLNNNIQWKMNSQATNGGGSAVLRTVLEHEIGHLSGFEHSSSSPVMSSNYNPRSDPSLLSDSDLINLKRTYGRCTGKFYSLIDVQWRTNYPDGSVGLFYRTLITKETLVWQYSNQEGRPTDEYPIPVNSEFPQFQGTPTAVFQIYTYEAPKYVDDVYLIRGNFYQKYVSKSYGMTYTGESGTMSTFDIPNNSNVDTAVFDPRNERIYFFVGSTVYEVQPKYNAAGLVTGYSRTATFQISQLLPPASSQPNGRNTAYLSGVDAVYIHVTGEMYLLKDLHIWKNIGFSLGNNNNPANSIQYLGTQADPGNDHLWDFLCNPFICKS